MVREKRQHTIQTTEKTVELLQILADGEQGLKINDLAARLQISREEVLLLLVAMENRGFVAWDNRRKVYNPGGNTMVMARNLMQHGNRIDSMHPAMAAA